MADNQATAELTDDDINEMARKSRVARQLDAHDERWRLARRGPRRSPPGAAAGAKVPLPKKPAGGATADQEADNGP